MAIEGMEQSAKPAAIPVISRILDLLSLRPNFLPTACPKSLLSEQLHLHGQHYPQIDGLSCTTIAKGTNLFGIVSFSSNPAEKIRDIPFMLFLPILE